MVDLFGFKPNKDTLEYVESICYFCELYNCEIASEGFYVETKNSYGIKIHFYIPGLDESFLVIHFDDITYEQKTIIAYYWVSNPDFRMDSRYCGGFEAVKEDFKNNILEALLCK